MPEVLNLFGASWRSYVLEPCPVGTIFKPICAVYVLCRREPRRWEVLCVGETHSLHERFNFDDGSHYAVDRSILQDASHIGVLPTRSEEDRQAIVSDLQAGLRPGFDEHLPVDEDSRHIHAAAG